MSTHSAGAEASAGAPVALGTDASMQVSKSTSWTSPHAVPPTPGPFRSEGLRPGCSRGLLAPRLLLANSHSPVGLRLNRHLLQGASPDATIRSELPVPYSLRFLYSPRESCSQPCLRECLEMI